MNVAHKSELMHENSLSCQGKGCKNLMFIILDFSIEPIIRFHTLLAKRFQGQN